MGSQKAIAAAVAAALSFAVAHFGLNVEGEVQNAIVTIVTAVVVYFVPNKPKTA